MVMMKMKMMNHRSREINNRQGGREGGRGGKRKENEINRKMEDEDVPLN